MNNRSGRSYGALARLFFAALVLAASVAQAWADGGLKLFDLGDFRLESGDVVRNCRLAYRTFGEPSADGSNIVLFPTWLAGTSKDLAETGFIGPGRLADSSRYFVVAVDGFGNGVSSSPSTSTRQPGASFPRFSIHDMVGAEHALLAGHLGFSRIYAVVGISMGAMETFEWIVSHPRFMSRAVAVSGTPRPTSYDKLAWESEIGILDAVKAGDGAAMRALMPVHRLLSMTPAHFAAPSSGEAPALLSSIKASAGRYNADDWKSQLQAMLAHDAFRASGSEEKAAAVVRARTLVVVSKDDAMVYPGPAKSFAKKIGAETAELTGDCGHLAAFCEEEKLTGVVRRFLESKSPPDTNSWKRHLILH